MRVNVVMPKMGESLNEGTIIKWYKKVGETVQKDEIIFEISTDKVDTEIPSPEDGVIVEIKAYEQETVEVDNVVAVIETNGSAEVQPEVEEKKETPSTAQVGGDLVEVVMPKMGESVMEGTIVKWYKKVGDKIEKDEILFEISTDKVDTEVPSSVEGTVAEILFKENETVEIDTVVAKISTSGGIVQPKQETKSETGSAPEQRKEEIPEPKIEKVSNVVMEEPQAGRFYSPLVMNIARKENISMSELDRIKGTGISGRVSKKDILKYIEDKHKGIVSAPAKHSANISHPAASAPEPANIQKGEKFDTIPMDNIRQRIMDHMVLSRDTSVHVTEVMDVDMSVIYNFIQKNKAKFLENDGIKLTYMPIISYAAIRALKEFPLVNSSIEGKNIIQKKYINLGFAVAVEPNGLIVPNIKNADEKNVRGLARSITELSNKSRNKGLTPDDISGGTFTITNYGVFGALHGNPIINQPEVAILGVGAVKKQPVVIEVNGMDTIGIKPVMYLSLSHDHRLVDGMLGGKFLKMIKDTLESFDVNIV